MEPNRINKILDSFSHKRILVIGDLYLDEYIHAAGKEISPEHPVVRAVAKSKTHEPGAAGHVSSCFNTLGAPTSILAVTGKDHYGDILIHCLQVSGVNTQFVIRDNDPTGVFSRIMLYDNRSENHIIRLDYEVEPTSEKIQENILEILQKNMDKFDVLFFADYNENQQDGVVTKKLIENVLELNKIHKKMLVGISRNNLNFFEGFDLVVMNEREAKNLLKVPLEGENLIREAIHSLKVKYLVITKGEDGLIASDGKSIIEMSSLANKVIDVCGAGDTFSSTLTLALLSDATLQEAAEIGSAASAVCIGKEGVLRNANRDEIMEFIKAHYKIKNKILNEPELLEIRRRCRLENKKVVFVNGYFDLIHSGHILFLKEAKKQGDMLIVGINSDSSTRENKGKDRPLMSQVDRSLIISSLEFVDYVIIFNELTPIRLLTILTPDVLVKGSNYKETEIVGKDIVEEYGGKVLRFPLLSGKSSEKIINLMRKTNENT